jgi:hypothetical protein
MKGYTKSDVDTHGREALPAVNVKVHYFGGGLSADDFGCTEDVFETALEYAFMSAQEAFWYDDAPALAKHRLGPYVTIHSEGRSGGWLVVSGLDDVDDWDAVTLNKWALFERDIQREVAYRSSKDVVREDILANRWAEDGAKLFNFATDADGQDYCLLDRA